MRFKVIPNCFHDASHLRNRIGKEFPIFLLEEDNWNDYGFFTLYHLHYAGPETDNIPVYIGSIRIMQIGQQEYQTNLIDQKFGRAEFKRLPDDFVSLTLSNEFFRGIVKYLKTEKDRKAFIDAIHLILTEEEVLNRNLMADDCFVKSLLRDTTLSNQALAFGREYMLNEFSNYDPMKQMISIKFSDCTADISIKFDPSEGKNKSKMLPSRIVAFIGENGCGKTTILYRIIRLLYASPDKRNLDKKVEKLTPNDIGYAKLIMISYSAFDNYVLPGVSERDFKLIVDNFGSEESRFIFCGIRDVKSDYESWMKDLEQKRIVNGGDRIVVNERFESHHNKKPEALTEEFAEILMAIYNDRDKKQYFTNFISDLKDRGYESLRFPEREFIWWDEDVKSEVKTAFNELSTGWKYILHSYANILLSIENNSLLLFDEPENHLHPPLLSLYISEIRRLLDAYNSVMFIATHSPVVVQELYSSNVFVVRRTGDKLTVIHPNIQTFGSTFGEIESDVFNLNSDLTNFHEIVDEVLNSVLLAHEDSSGVEILEKMEQIMGISLSAPLRGYVLSKLYSKA